MKKNKPLTPRQFLRKLELLGMSQAAFAKRIHKSRRTLTRYATGRTPIPYLVINALDAINESANAANPKD